MRWLDGQVREAGVELRLETPATAEAVLKEAPDIVVVATGGAAPPAFKGAEHAVTSWHILSGQAAAGSNVLVYDECGQHQGIGCADSSRTRAAAVELVTPTAWPARRSAPQLSRPICAGSTSRTS